MGLLDMLTKGWTKNPNGSAYAAMPNGATPPTNPLATKQSRLHATSFASVSTKGYSTTGLDSGTSIAYAQYNDGVLNPLPSPSQLEFGDPTSSTLYGDIKGKNTYISGLTENPAGITE
jgi:hypothetical protein